MKRNARSIPKCDKMWKSMQEHEKTLTLNNYKNYCVKVWSKMFFFKVCNKYARVRGGERKGGGAGWGGGKIWWEEGLRLKEEE